MEKNVIPFSVAREKKQQPVSASEATPADMIDFAVAEKLNKIREERQRLERLKANEQVLKTYRIKSSK